MLTGKREFDGEGLRGILGTVVRDPGRSAPPSDIPPAIRAYASELFQKGSPLDGCRPLNGNVRAGSGRRVLPKVHLNRPPQRLASACREARCDGAWHPRVRRRGYSARVGRDLHVAADAVRANARWSNRPALLGPKGFL